jgi:hypothetical protein
VRGRERERKRERGRGRERMAPVRKGCSIGTLSHRVLRHEIFATNYLDLEVPDHAKLTLSTRLLFGLLVVQSLVHCFFPPIFVFAA